MCPWDYPWIFRFYYEKNFFFELWHLYEAYENQQVTVRKFFGTCNLLLDMIMVIEITGTLYKLYTFCYKPGLLYAIFYLITHEKMYELFVHEPSPDSISKISRKEKRNLLLL